MSAIIEIDHLTREFNGVVAVDDLTLVVEEGELFGLVGPDGAGKTTTMRLLCGILEPSGGDARVSGFSIRTHGERIKARIGYMSRRLGLYGDLTVMENLSFYMDIYQVPHKERPERIHRLLEFSQLGPFLDRLARDLSGGMRQKLGLACSLVHTPEVLFLDEPTCGVDPVSRRDLWKILYELAKQGVTVFMSTAYLDEAERCTRVGLIHDGRLMVCGPPSSIRGDLPGEVWEIRSEDNRLARDRIRAMEDVTADLVGDTLHLIFGHPGGDIDLLTRRLNGEGVRVLERRKVPPSLEDAFMHLIHRGGEIAKNDVP
jgi:ABC-2 type transport system ATP-binding protein